MIMIHGLHVTQVWKQKGIYKIPFFFALMETFYLGIKWTAIRGISLLSLLVGIAYIPYRISLISEHGIERECERSENARSEQEKHKPPLYISLYIEVLIFSPKTSYMRRKAESRVNILSIPRTLYIHWIWYWYKYYCIVYVYWIV